VRRSVFSICSLICALGAGLDLWPSCRGEKPAATELPPPGNESRAPGSGPEAPRLAVKMPDRPTAGPTRILAAGDDLQRALDEAKPGDVIALEPRAIFAGHFLLPQKPGNQWITIRTSVTDHVFPPAGTRVNPSHASLMPVIEASSGPAVRTASGAHHYRFIGIEIRPQAGAFIDNLVTLGTTETSVDELPHHIVFERCYLHGDAQIGGRRGIALNSRYTAVVDSYLADFKENDADSQAIAGWNGLGPFAIVNNYLEGAGENLLFGGADPTVNNLVPADIEIRGNYFNKPLSWKIGHPGYVGTRWVVKALFELKNAHRVLIDGNIFENNWQAQYPGYNAIQFTVRDDNGTAPWVMVRDVTFTNNIIRHVNSAVFVLGSDDIYPSAQTKRILIRNNLFDDVNHVKWGGTGRFIRVFRGASEVVVDHNTAIQTSSVIWVPGGDANLGFVYTNNLTPHNTGVEGAGTGVGKPTLTTYLPGAAFVRNVLAGGNAALYPANNFFPASLSNVLFMDLSGGNYRLQPSSPYKNAGTDGKDIGADIVALESAVTRGGKSVPK
jgi:hypothetical protein